MHPSWPSRGRTSSLPIHIQQKELPFSDTGGEHPLLGEGDLPPTPHYPQRGSLLGRHLHLVLWAPPLMLLALRSRLWPWRWRWLPSGGAVASSSRLSCLIGVAQSERRWLNLHKLTMFRNCSHWCSSEFLVPKGVWGAGPHGHCSQSCPSQSSSSPVSTLQCPVSTLSTVSHVYMFVWGDRGQCARFIDLMLQCTYYPSGGHCLYHCHCCHSQFLLIPWQCDAICHAHASIHPTHTPIPTLTQRQWVGYMSIRVCHISAKLIDCGSLGLHSFEGYRTAVHTSMGKS